MLTLNDANHLPTLDRRDVKDKPLNDNRDTRKYDSMEDLGMLIDSDQVESIKSMEDAEIMC